MFITDREDLNREELYHFATKFELVKRNYCTLSNAKLFVEISRFAKYNFILFASCRYNITKTIR